MMSFETQNFICSGTWSKTDHMFTTYTQVFVEKWTSEFITIPNQDA